MKNHWRIALGSFIITLTIFGDMFAILDRASLYWVLTIIPAMVILTWGALTDDIQ